MLKYRKQVYTTAASVVRINGPALLYYPVQTLTARATVDLLVI